MSYQVYGQAEGERIFQKLHNGYYNTYVNYWGGEIVKRSRLATGALVLVFSGVITLTPHAYAANQTVSISSPDAVTSLPAHYVFTQTITLTNTENASAYDVKANIVLLPPETSYSQVSLTGESIKPVAVHHDQYGNLIGTFVWSTLAPHQTVTLTLHYADTSYDVSYKLPKVYPTYNIHSVVYQTYTNPQLEAQEVNTDSPVLEHIVAQVIRPGENPEQEAHALFEWIVKNIRYNYTLQASGSAVATAESHLGICSDIADLYVGLLRTAHIPARFVGGYVTNNGSGQGGFHQWTEFYLPSVGWVVADPTWGAYGYFAALQDNWHIALYDGIRKDIVIHWSYSPQLLSAQDASHQIRIHYQYHFYASAQQAAAPSEQAPPIVHPQSASASVSHDPPATAPTRQQNPSLWQQVTRWIDHTATLLVHWLGHL